MIQVIVLSNKRIIRDGLCNALNGESDIQVVGNVERVSDMLRLNGSQHPDVLVMDAMLPDDTDFMATVRDVLAKPDPPEILAYSMDGQANTIRRAFEAGVRGYLLYCEDHALIVEAVRAIMQGKRWFSPELV